MSVKKIAILFSGRGSNLLNLFEKLHKKTFYGTTVEVALTITNVKNAGGIEYSRKFGIEPIVIEHKKFAKREDFDAQIVKTIKAHDIDLTVLAGFMRILTPVFTDEITSINLHPSILPMFKGADAIRRSYESDMLIGGVSVHFVNEELHGGKLVSQVPFQKKGMSYEEFEEKIHKTEYEVLPKSVVKVLCNMQKQAHI